jgi:hypothetical protein
MRDLQGRGLARLDRGPVATTVCGNAGQFDSDPMAATDFAQAVGSGAGAPFPVEGDLAATIADADAHVVPPGADRVRCGSTRPHQDRLHREGAEPNRPLSVIRFRPHWPVETWVAEVQGETKRVKNLI